MSRGSAQRLGRARLDSQLGVPERIVGLFRRDVPLILLDAAVVCIAYLVPLVLRFDGSVPDLYWAHFWTFLPLAITVHVFFNYVFGLYGQMWRYASVHEARSVVLSGLTAGAVIVGIGAWLMTRLNYLPISVMALGAVLSLLGFGIIRFQSRLFALRRSAVAGRRRVLIVGGGVAGSALLKDLLTNQTLGLEAVGVVDDDPRKVGRALHGVRVVGSVAQIPSLVGPLDVDQVLLAIPSANSEVFQGVAAICERANVTVRVLPSVQEMVGRVSARDIRDLRIEDLLGRNQVEMDVGAIAEMISGRRVLITGAGGSIGSEIALQVLGFSPSSLILIDHDETHLHDLQISLGPQLVGISVTEGETSVRNATDVETVLADVRDQNRILSVFLRYRPEVVFHAAAHKHLPVLETYPEEAIRTNIIGTANVAEAAAASGVHKFVLISTDKAVNPISVMGASKWFAEQVVRSYDGKDTVYCAVRFGNVLGSRGSVIPTFFKQIEQGGPVTVTHPEMARYFMSVHESVQLVLQAAAQAGGGEVFTLDMGDPVQILELAQRLIRLSGLVPERDVRIEIVGPRPGEKLVEEVVSLDEQPLPSGHPSIMVSRPPVPDQAILRRALWDLEELAAEGRSEELAGAIKEIARQTGDPDQIGELKVHLDGSGHRSVRRSPTRSTSPVAPPPPGVRRQP